MMRFIRFFGALLVALAGVLVAAGPARAAATVDGYVWASQPAAVNYFAATGYERNSAGGPIEMTRSGAGDYRIRFHSMGVPGGVAHAWAYGAGNGGYCAIVNWGQSGPDEVVRVRCFDGLGAASDMRYVATFTNRKPVGDPFVYLWADQAVPAAPYVPSLAYSYDSTGGGIKVERTAVGHYRVYSPAVAELYATGYYEGNFRANAYHNGPARCAVMEPAGGPPVYVEVICLTVGAFTPVDTRFTFSAGRGVNALGIAPPHASAVVWPNPADPPTVMGWSSPGGAPTAVELGEGIYRVTFPDMAVPRGLAVANAFGIVPFYCHVAAWWPSGADEVVQVECWEPPPVVMNTTAFFTVAFTT